MNKSDLLQSLKSKNDSFSEEDVESSINLILKFISNTLAKANRVEIRNFGSFSARKRDKRLSRNPKTGTSVLVEPKNHPYFRASKNLKESLNQ
ncbi:integration host factor subunit beta [Gammaproteobacteria bacterium]|nr:integration host factor subunit beta [Gammaproteobacteria bacterium]